jgi:hypothetical protein
MATSSPNRTGKPEVNDSVNELTVVTAISRTVSTRFLKASFELDTICTMENEN